MQFTSPRITFPATITDTQIRALRDSREWNPMWLREFAIALGEAVPINDPTANRKSSLARCTKLLKQLRQGAAYLAI